jgi:hypothetical protein
MNTDKDIKEEILVYATRMLHYNNLLIAQCDSWLSAEEGMKQMEKRIRERAKKRKKYPCHNA